MNGASAIRGQWLFNQRKLGVDSGANQLRQLPDRELTRAANVDWPNVRDVHKADIASIKLTT